MRFERHHSALIVASVVTVASFVAATAYTQSRLARFDSVSSTIETDAVPSIEYLSHAAVSLTRLDQWLDAVATGGPQQASARAAARRELSVLEAAVAAYVELPPLPGEDEHWAAVRDRTRHAAGLIREMLDSGTGPGAPSAPSAGTVDDAVDAAVRTVAATLDFDIRQSKAMARDLRDVRAATLGMVVRLDVGSSLIALMAAIVAYRASRRHDQVLRQHSALLSDRVGELDRFAGQVAHDILSPLGTIATALPLLERPGDARTAQYVDRSRRAVGRVQQLVEALLLFARSGAHPDPPARCVVAPVLRAVAADCAAALEENGIDLRIETADGIEARCTAGVLTSIVQNLVRNAIRYMGSPPVRQIIVCANGVADLCRIEVEDSGAGIPGDSIRNIFEPFVRGPNAVGSGTGLGLATVKRLVESHGGTVAIRSELGAGSVFAVELPTPPHTASEPI
jgi:signal transduction histidine kinase